MSSSDAPRGRRPPRATSGARTISTPKPVRQREVLDLIRDVVVYRGEDHVSALERASEESAATKEAVACSVMAMRFPPSCPEQRPPPAAYASRTSSSGRLGCRLVSADIRGIRGRCAPGSPSITGVGIKRRPGAVEVHAVGAARACPREVVRGSWDGTIQGQLVRHHDRGGGPRLTASRRREAPGRATRPGVTVGEPGRAGPGCRATIPARSPSALSPRRTISRTSSRSCWASYTMPSLIV